MNPNAFFLYCENFSDDFGYLLKEIISLILNENVTENKAIALKTGKKLSLVSGILDYFDYMGYIKLARTSDGTMWIFKIFATGKRNLRQIMEN